MSLAAMRALVPDTAPAPPVGERALSFRQLLSTVPEPPCTWPVRCRYYARCAAEPVCCASFARYVSGKGGGSWAMGPEARTPGDRPTAGHWHRTFVLQAEREAEVEAGA